MAIESVNGLCQPLTNAGVPVLYRVSEVSNFYEQMGNNTDYVIHPEETMANNFAYMVMQKTDVPNPEILESIRKFFLK